MIIVDKIIEKMLEEVKKHQLELMDHYPNDILVHDRAKLENLIVPGAKLAWMVGHLHTHMVFLGIHHKENDIVNCLLNLSRSDKFYVLEIKNLSEDGFTLKQITNKEFEALSNTPVRYSKKGESNFDFSVFDHEEPIGRVNIEVEGGYSDRVFACTVLPRENITKMQETALRLWSTYGTTEASGTLFAASTFKYVENHANQSA